MVQVRGWTRCRLSWHLRQVQEADGKEVLEGHCRTDGMVNEGENLE